MNHLAHTLSPYLLEHASNPVEWYPWGEEAFARARLEDKPIFLSIGYSTCHWCHVMARESFENEAIAALLNKDFISIKVDREERPDVDRLYMNYLQAFTGSGGWPMSIWLTPERKPFFGGTYFPKENTYGRVGFASVLAQLAELWKANREQVEQESLRVLRSLEQALNKDASFFSKIEGIPLERACGDFLESFDKIWGGFGPAPKFPRPCVLFFLLRYAYAHDSQQGRHAREMVLLTLRKMAAGGIHDHLGGGFHRYAVDQIWQVPHFEKMLYDQAQLALAYLEAYALTEDQQYGDVVHTILSYVKREMSGPCGEIYSAQDADSLQSSGIKSEGAFYIWSDQEMRALLSESEYSVFARCYHVDARGNIPIDADPHQEMAEKNIFMTHENENFSDAEQKILEESRVKLFQAREKRPRPHRDEKVLTSWNALMISAYARSGATLGRKDYIDAAIETARFLQTHLYDCSSRELSHSWFSGQSIKSLFAEDYSFLIQGLLDLYEATFDEAWLQWAKTLQTKMDDLFWDHTQGGYFSSVADDAHLLLRIKEEYDGAEPSANSIAALNHLRFSRMLDDQTHEEQAAAIFHASARILEKMPAAVPQLLAAFCCWRMPLSQVVILGELAWSDTQHLLAQTRKGFQPDQVLILIEGALASSWLAQQNRKLRDMKPVKGKAVLYRCDHFCCKRVML